MKTLNASQAIISTVMKYPSLYASTSFERSKYKVLDHIFNVIGNGISDFEDFQDKFPYTDDLPLFLDDKYINDQPLFEGYKKVRVLDKGEAHAFLMPEYTDNEDDCIKGVSEDEKKNHPDVLLWISIKLLDDDIESLAPYPNFQKRYSIIHEMDKDNLVSLDISWIEACEWFYTKSLDYFQTSSESYSYAYPAKSKYENDRYAETIIKSLEKNKNEGLTLEQSYTKITKDYEREFDGDIEKFFTEGWRLEKERIIKFIEATLSMLGEVKDYKSQLDKPAGDKSRPKPSF